MLFGTPLLFLVGCIGLTGRVGTEVQALGDSSIRMGAEIEGRYSLDPGYMRLSALASVRGAPSYAAVGVGGEGCIRTMGWSTAIFCARIRALELGSDRGSFTLGTVSPALTVGWWRPVKSRPKPIRKPRRRGARGTLAQGERVLQQWTTALEPTFAIGAHVQPVGPERFTPYLSLTFGGGLGASNMYGRLDGR